MSKEYQVWYDGKDDELVCLLLEDIANGDVLVYDH